MSEENKRTDKNDTPESNGRRDALKTLISVPVFGAMAYGVYKKTKHDLKRKNIGDVFKLDSIQPSGMETQPSGMETQPSGKQIRLGVIGFGIRGKQLMRAAGFAEPQFIEKLKEKAKKDSKDTRYQDYMEQENLNIVINGVCDIFDVYGEAAVLTGSNINREGLNGKYGTPPKRYRYYKELLAAENIDAVIIATPDHWHATMAMDAAKAGKHVYMEKPASWTVPETYLLRETIRNTNIVFQLGHQGRQTDSYIKAKEIVDKGILGPVTLIETCTNRNDPNGAWVYPIIEGSNSQSIDWKQFEGDPERVKEYMEYMQKCNLARYVGPDTRDKFSLERFFRWRCWWDYSTGLSGDLLTHEYDAINQILKVGIPHSVTSSGGVYFFKDGRTVPDVLQTTMEFPDKNLTFLYSATLASERDRGKVFMGHDASMELSNMITLKADARSERYKEKIEQGIIQPNVPFFTYRPGQTSVDAISSATELYFAQRGLVSSYIGGKKYDTTFLHIREWLECIRQGLKPSCGIDEAFEEAMSAHMGTRAYLEGKTMYWDKEKEEIVYG